MPNEVVPENYLELQTQIFFLKIKKLESRKWEKE